MAFNAPSSLNTFMPQNLPGTGAGAPVGLLPMIRDGKPVSEHEKKLSQFFRPGNVAPNQAAPREAPGKSNQAQTNGVSAPMTTAELKGLNPNWTGRSGNSHRMSTQQIALVGSSLVKSGLVRQTQGEYDVLTKNLTLAPGIIIPAGSKVSGSAIPATGPLYDVGRPSKNLTFTLPNGNAIKFESTFENTQGKGATSIEFLDSKRNSLGKTDFVSTLFLDTKNNALRFTNQAGPDVFRLSDLRAQANSSESRRSEASGETKSGAMSKDQLRSVVERLGLGSL
jgi:hypothetical protein